MTREEEIHALFVGGTGEGKSKLLEKRIRKLIDEGEGLMFLDGSDGARTMNSLIAYCAKNKVKNVVIVDPSYRFKFGKICCLNPLHSRTSLKNPSIANINDAFRSVYKVKDASDTARIQRYMTAILRVLANAELSLYESLYFTDRESADFYRKRLEILNFSPEDDRHRLALEEVFTTRSMFVNEMQSTIRRFEPLYDDTLSLMVSHDGLKMTDVVSKKMKVFVNMSWFGWEQLEQRLLGTLYINELIFAILRLREHDWKGRFHLFIDEAGLFATRKLADLMAYKRKSGLRVTVAYQYPGQIEDRYIAEAFMNLTYLKVMFNMPSPTDRLEMIKALGYGGEIQPTLAAYVHNDLPKQYAIIKKGKEPPRRVRIPDVPDIKISKEELEEYIRKTLQAPWYFLPKDVKDEISKRLIQSGKATYSEVFDGGKAADHKTTRKTSQRKSPFGGAKPKGL